MCDATVNGRMVAALLADVLLHNYRDEYHKNKIYKKYRIYRTPQKYRTLYDAFQKYRIYRNYRTSGTTAPVKLIRFHTPFST